MVYEMFFNKSVNLYLGPDNNQNYVLQVSSVSFVKVMMVIKSKESWQYVI